MSNSKLVTYTLLSPNHSGKRTMAIDRITPHCVVGQLTAAGICGCFTSSSVQASCNYGIGKDGDIGLCVDEGNRSWCTSSNANDQRAVTIECASDKTHPYAFTNKCYNALVNLCVDICKRNGKRKLIWFGDKATTLNYSPKSDEMVLTVHRWFANKACPGDWMYSRMGDLAQKVTALLSGETIDSSTSTAPKTYYRVRKSWSDAKSQIGAYEILENAKNNCPVGYTVFDKKGKVVYTKEASNSEETDKIWMGWTKRETGSAGLRCIHGDNGKAYGLQFDYRYGLIPFLKYCVEYNAERYAGFKPYIALGAGNSGLIYNNGLGKLWKMLYDSYTEEFEQLQYTCAYQQYYLPAKAYCLKNYRLDMDKCHPAVKGTLWSMSFRSGTQTGAQKFSGCAGKSDEAILNAVYPKYGNNDGGRWTRAGQWGDALNALKKDIYTSVYKEMKKKTEDVKKEDSKKEETSTVAGMKYTVQCGVFAVEANAKKQAKSLKKKGFEAIVKKRSNDWAVQCGVFKEKKNADALIEKLKKAGFSAILHL